MAYQRFEERLPVKQERQLREAPAPRRRKKARVHPSVFACIAVLAVVSVYILFCQMQLTELNTEVSKANTKLDELTAENVSLTTKKANSMDMDEYKIMAGTSYKISKNHRVKLSYLFNHNIEDSAGENRHVIVLGYTYKF